MGWCVECCSVVLGLLVWDQMVRREMVWGRESSGLLRCWVRIVPGCDVDGVLGCEKVVTVALVDDCSWRMRLCALGMLPVANHTWISHLF